MTFTSFSFLLFFPIVCIVYYSLPWNKVRIAWLLVASYYFYMLWQPAFGILLLVSTFISYLSGIYMETVGKKKLVLTLGILANIAILFFYKYFNFAGECITHLMNFLGIDIPIPRFDILLPIGISFYTFQVISYLVDVYRGKVKAEKNFLIFTLYVSLFTKIAQGPIERAADLLPQLKKKHPLLYRNVVDGVRMILWGCFMKLCVADCLVGYVDAVFNNYEHHNGTSLLISVFFYSIQIYADFAGYSLVALGTSRILGYRLTENFRRPYFAMSITDFWRRWHISLSTWLRDYIYIPLGGNRVQPIRKYTNIFLTFLVSGIWHGASLTYIFWGMLHGIFQIIEKLLGFSQQKYKGLSRLVHILMTFIVINFTWIFFRAPDFPTAFHILTKICTNPGVPFTDMPVMLLGGFAMLILFLKDFKDEYGSSNKLLSLFSFHSPYRILRFASFILLAAYVLNFGTLNGSSFIYFQF